MVLGGVGSLRLGSKFLGTKEVYPLGASSNGISHQGIPILLGEYEYRRISQSIQESGGCLASVSGYVKIISQEVLPVRYGARIPKLAIVVDDIEIVKNGKNLEQTVELLTTVAITFGTDYELTNKKWSFCSFDPIHQPLNQAIDWLKDYSRRYSTFEGRPIILADFDEHMDHFTDPIEFPLADVLRDQIDRYKLGEYQRALYYTFNIQGDLIMDNSQDNRNATFINIGGQQFVGRFNNTIANLNASGKQEFANALDELAKAVNDSQHLSGTDKIEKGEVIQKLGEEVAKPQPNKTMAKALGEGLMAALKSIPDVMKAATDLAPFLQNILR